MKKMMMIAITITVLTIINSGCASIQIDTQDDLEKAISQTVPIYEACRELIKDEYKKGNIDKAIFEKLIELDSHIVAGYNAYSTAKNKETRRFGAAKIMIACVDLLKIVSDSTIKDNRIKSGINALALIMNFYGGR